MDHAGRTDASFDVAAVLGCPSASSYGPAMDLADDCEHRLPATARALAFGTEGDPRSQQAVPSVT